MTVSTADSTPRHSLRHTWSLIALIAGIVFAPIAFVAHHVVVLSTDTDRVAGALDPVLDLPEVQQGLVSALTDPLEEFLTSDELIQRIVDSAGLGITVPPVLDDALTELLQPLIDEPLTQVNAGVTEIIASEPFARSWRQIIADTHGEFAAIVQSDPGTPSPELTLSLRPFLVDIRDGLVEQGFSFFEGVPVVDIRLGIIDADTMGSLRSVIQVASVADPWGVALVGVLLAGAIVFSPRRKNAWAIAGGGVALSMIGVVAVMWLVRTVWIPIQFPNSADIATPIADALLDYPISQAALIAVVSATVGVVGWAIESRIARQKAMS